jgi:hypothetical protein
VDTNQAAGIADSGALVVSGYFDPLLAEHTERLAELKGDHKTLLVLIANPENPVLPTAARSQLVASLRSVDYVAELAPGLKAQIHLEQEDARRFSQLLDRVHQCVS